MAVRQYSGLETRSIETVAYNLLCTCWVRYLVILAVYCDRHSPGHKASRPLLQRLRGWNLRRQILIIAQEYIPCDSPGFTVVEELVAEMATQQDHPQTLIPEKSWMIEDLQLFSPFWPGKNFRRMRSLNQNFSKPKAILTCLWTKFPPDTSLLFQFLDHHSLHAGTNNAFYCSLPYFPPAHKEKGPLVNARGKYCFLKKLHGRAMLWLLLAYCNLLPHWE